MAADDGLTFAIVYPNIFPFFDAIGNGAEDKIEETGTTKLFGEFAPIGTLSSALEAHKADKANPHGVTTTQIGAAKAAHAHGNLTSGGAIGSTADLPVMTGEEGKLTAVSPAAAREKLGLAKVAATGSYTDLTNRPAALTIDAAVTATGANPVTGKAVADYVTQQINAITDYEAVKF